MPYTVDPNDWLTPLDSQDAKQGAEEFRALKGSLNEVRASGVILAVASGGFANIWNWDTPMNVTEVVEYWIAANINPALWTSYGEHGIIYKTAAGVGSRTRLIVGTLSDVQLSGANLQYKQSSGAAQDVYYRIYGRKRRTPY